MFSRTMSCHVPEPVEVEYDTEGNGEHDDPLVINIESVWSEEYGHVELDQDAKEMLAADICERHEFDNGHDDEPHEGRYLSHEWKASQ